MALKCAFLFPGQGSQAFGMGKEFYDSDEKSRRIMGEAGERISVDFSKLLFEENDLLEQTQYTQPAILLISSIAHRLFENEMALKPVFALGHSLGEFSALVSVGALDIVDGVELVNIRGKLMADACAGKDVGMLVSLGLKDDVVQDLCSAEREKGAEVWPVNYNSEGQIVIAGLKNDLQRLEPLLKESGARRAMLLNMSVASHCPILQEAVEPFGEALKRFIKDEFISPVVSNVNAEKYDDAGTAIELLPRQLVSPVLYKQSIKRFDPEIDCYIEFGYGSVLKGLNRKTTSKPHFNVSDMASLEDTIRSLEKIS